MKFIITSAYGAVESVRGSRPHTGVDLAMPMDTPLRSFCDGIVEKVTNGAGGIGNGVIIRAKDGVRYIYGHLDDVKVHVGDQVSAGTLIGLSGSSGHSTGPHLHFAETINGQFVDPTPVISQVDAMAGPNPVQDSSWFSNFLDNFNIEKHVHDATEHAIMGALSSVGDVVLHTAYAVTLVGAGGLIVLKTCGFEHRWLRPSVLIITYVLLRFLFGGA